MKAFAAGEEILNGFFRDVLEEIGVEATTIEPHIKPENIIKALRKDEFDLAIITNSDLGPLDIPDLIRQIKLEHPGIIVIAISGYVTKELVNCIAVAGADAFMQLPVRIKELQAVVRRFM